MSGNRFLLDTNAIILLLKGKLPELDTRLQNADWIGISVISYVEFQSFSNISEEDIKLFETFASRVEVVGLNTGTELPTLVSSIRKQGNLKLPDAIIAATAAWRKATIVTADKGFEKQQGIDLLLVN